MVPLSTSLYQVRLQKFPLQICLEGGSLEMNHVGDCTTIQYIRYSYNLDPQYI